MSLTNTRTSITILSDPLCHYSQRIRIIQFEKEIFANIKNITAQEMNTELADINPYHSLPTLIEHDLVLYQSSIVAEYLDERFPHPPLLPPYPADRAKNRLILHRINQDFCKPLDILLNPSNYTQACVKENRELLRQRLISFSSLFKQKAFFLNDFFSLIDCYLLPILWRLSFVKIEIPKAADSLIQYSNRLFKRPSFQKSLSDQEKTLRA
ncbi:MAG: stringent starvation protein A [Endozoicomonadaceae bacterium]|nr:stringent starvation protein A [Endozoicomonadaceae bacterium]